MVDSVKTNTAERRKPKISKDVVMCVVVLSAIALVAGVLLGVMNWLTYEDPELKIIRSVAEAYGVEETAVSAQADRVINLDGGTGSVQRCFKVEKNGEVVYVYHSVGKGAKSGTLELLVHITSKGLIREVEEYSQSETAGYFKRVMDANRQKYLGVNITLIDEFELVKNGSADNEIAQVTNATMTSRGINNAINAAVYAFNSYSASAAEEKI